MNINQFKSEYSNFSNTRRWSGIQKLFEVLTDDIVSGHNDYKDLILDILDLAEMAEENDYFGTEGLNI